MAYELFCKSVIGSSHIRKAIPCEDFGIKTDCGKYRIFAAADGHGDPNCLRSHIGSEVICRIASEKLEGFARTIEEQGWEETLFDEEKAKQRVEELVRSIVGGWGEEVGKELEQNPLSEEEKQRAPAYAKEYEDGIRTERMYGTTLIAGLQTESYLLLLQQGDGRCVVFDCNGAASQPVPWDDRCVGTATTSLCDSDAVQSFRYKIINLQENPVIACIAGTDGVEDSFPGSMERMHVYYRKLLSYACENGVQALEEYLGDELGRLSKDGSADDITVSGIINVERVRPYLQEFAERNRLVNLEEEVVLLENKVISIEEGGKLQHLKRKHEEAEEARTKASVAYRAAYKVRNEAHVACNSAVMEYRKQSEDCAAVARAIAAQKRGVPIMESIPGHVRQRIKEMRFPFSFLSKANSYYENECKKKDDAERKLREAKENLMNAEDNLRKAEEERQKAEEKKESAQKEYQEFEQRRRDFVKQRDEAKKRLDEERARLDKPGES